MEVKVSISLFSMSIVWHMEKFPWVEGRISTANEIISICAYNIALAAGMCTISW